MITLFLNCCNSQRDNAEKPYMIDFESVYQIGDIVNRGRGYRWKIVRIDAYSGDTDLNIAYLQLADRDYIPECDWDSEVKPTNREEGVELEIQTVDSKPSGSFDLVWHFYGDDPFEPEIGSVFGTPAHVPNNPTAFREAAPFHKIVRSQRFTPIGDTVFKAVVLTNSERVDPDSVERDYRCYLICRETDFGGWDIDFGGQEFVVYRDLENLLENIYVNAIEEVEGEQYVLDGDTPVLNATCDRWIPYRHEVFTPSGDCSFDGIVVLFHKPVDEAVKHI